METLTYHRSPLTDSVPPSARQQLLALELRTQMTLHALDNASATVARLQADIETFMQDYYAQLGHEVEQLAALESQLEALQDQTTASQEEISWVPQPVPSAPPIEQQMKALYRSMVKECHPDAGGQAEMMRMVNDAYASRSLGAMWNAKWQMERWRHQSVSEPEVQARQLAHYAQEMKAQLDAMEAQRRALLESGAYALLQRAFQMKLCGQDFIAMVRAHLHQQTERARFRLMLLGLRQPTSAA